MGKRLFSKIVLRAVQEIGLNTAKELDKNLML